MVSEDIVYAVCSFQRPQRPAGGYHILPGGIVVHIVPRYHHDIRIFRLHGFHMLQKFLPVKGIAHMGIRKLYNAQASHLFVRFHRVRPAPHMIRQVPAAAQIYCRNPQGTNSRVISGEFCFSHLLGQLADTVAEQPDDHHMQNGNFGVDGSKPCSHTENDQRHRNNPYQKSYQLLPPGDLFYNGKSGKSARQVEEPHHRPQDKA